MRIAVRFVDDTAIVSLSGRFLAGSDGPYLRQKVADALEAGVLKMIIDFSDVPYIDSTGLGFLVGARSTVQKSGVRLVLAGVNSHVKKVLDEVKLTQFFNFAPDEKTALASMRESLQPAAATSPPTKSAKGKKRSSTASEL